VHCGHVKWCGLLNGSEPVVGDDDERASIVRIAGLAFNQTPPDHSGHVMGQPAVVPLGEPSQLERAKTPSFRFGEADEYLVVGFR
jgi:hypothetical protein